MNSKLVSVLWEKAKRKDNILNSKLEDNFIPDQNFIISFKIFNSFSHYIQKE